MITKASDSTVSLSNFTPEAKDLIGKAQQFADDSKHRLYEPIHLLAVLLDVPEVSQVLKELSVNTVAFNSQVHGYVAKLSAKAQESSSLAPSMIDFISKAKNNTDKKIVNTFDLFVTLSREDANSAVGSIFKSFNVTSERISGAVTSDKVKERDLNACPYFTNLTAQRKKNNGDVLIGRESEVRRLVQILARRSKNHPLLVGESGVGKRTLVLALTDRINNRVLPKAFHDHVVVQLNTSALLSGVTNKTEIEKKLNEALQYLYGYKAIVYIRSLDSLMVQGMNINIHSLLGNMLVKNNVQLITACSPDVLKKLQEKEPNFVKEMSTLIVEQTTPEVAIEVLRGVAHRYESHHNIKIGELAITTAVKLAKRYIQDRCLPESAIDLIDEAASNKMMETGGFSVVLDNMRSRIASIKQQLTGLKGDHDELSDNARKKLEKELESLSTKSHEHSKFETETESDSESILSEDAIASVLSEWTGIPAATMLQGDMDKLAHMDTALSKRVVGQEEAVQAITKAVRRSYMGLRDPNKPIGSFLFLGGSGCGKTEIAKALAQFLFNDESSITRIDCSELQERHNVSKLLGSPNGYSGSEDGGMLTEAVKKKPYSVILLDEIEKAHPDIFNILLAVLDDGRLTDGRGRTVSFANTIVILTSNIGSKKILEAKSEELETAEGINRVKEMVNKELLDFMRPELLNRIDTITIFKPLGRDQLGDIFDIQIKLLHKMLGDKQITVEVSQEAKLKFVELGYQPAYGARPLKRCIVKHIQDPLVDMIVKEQCPKNSTVHIGLSSDNFTIETK